MEFISPYKPEDEGETVEIHANHVTDMYDFVEHLDILVHSDSDLWDSSDFKIVDDLNGTFLQYIYQIDETINLLEQGRNKDQVLANLTGLKIALKGGTDKYLEIKARENLKNSGMFLRQLGQKLVWIERNISRMRYMLLGQTADNPEYWDVINRLDEGSRITEEIVEAAKQIPDDSDFGLEEMVYDSELLETLARLSNMGKIERIDTGKIEKLKVLEIELRDFVISISR